MFASNGQSSIDGSQGLLFDWGSIDHSLVSLAIIVTFLPLKSDRKLSIFFKTYLNKLSRDQSSIYLSHNCNQELSNRKITHQIIAQAFKNKGD